MKILPLLQALLPILICTCGLIAARADVPAEEMARAADKFLASLNAEQKAKATFNLKDEERANWHYVPKIRKGLTIKEMASPQRELAHALLSSGLSEQGYRKATNIISLELILKDLESATRQMVRDPELYYVSIFGQPGAKETWGWRVEGHHLSVNFTIVKGQYVSATPSFFGSNPAEVKEGSRKGLRVLAGEEDLGRQLVKSLTADQRKLAVIETTAPKEIITGAERKAKPLEPTGILAAKLTSEQSGLLLNLVQEYVHRHRPALAKEDLQKIQKAGFDKIGFAWAGGLERGEGHYYRIQGPTFLMEYDNTQNNNNHIHAVWRDFENDFGDDILRRHYEQAPHGN